MNAVSNKLNSQQECSKIFYSFWHPICLLLLDIKYPCDFHCKYITNNQSIHFQSAFIILTNTTPKHAYQCYPSDERQHVFNLAVNETANASIFSELQSSLAPKWVWVHLGMRYLRSERCERGVTPWGWAGWGAPVPGQCWGGGPGTEVSEQWWPWGRHHHHPLAFWI